MKKKVGSKSSCIKNQCLIFSAFFAVGNVKSVTCHA